MGGRGGTGRCKAGLQRRGGAGSVWEGAASVVRMLMCNGCGRLQPVPSPRSPVPSAFKPFKPLPILLQPQTLASNHLNPALFCFRRDLEGSERVLGPDHPGTLTSVGNLASLLKAQGKLQEAEPLYRCEGRGGCWLKCGSDV